jgi:hypothetical protein
VGVSPAPVGRGAPDPAGSTGAVLSMVDAAAGRVEVVRRWPGAPSDVGVYPFVPYFWDGCPGGSLPKPSKLRPPLPTGSPL